MSRRAAPAEIEVAPESDRFGDYPHPRHAPALFGHEAAADDFVRAARSGRMPHAWLVHGPHGIGKASFVWRAATALVLAGPDGLADDLAPPPGDPGLRLIAALSHPGIVLLRRPWDAERKRHASAIPVDEVRRIGAFLTRTARPGGWRAVIVDTADDLNEAAANALLKRLEEPPAQTVLFLISDRPARLLPTIRSRCRRLGLNPLDAAAMKRALAALAPDSDPRTRDAAIALSGGSVARALAFLEPAARDLAEAMRRAVLNLGRGAPGDLHALADGLGRAADERSADLALDIAEETLGVLALAAAGLPAEDGAGEAASAAPAPVWADMRAAARGRRARADALFLDRRQLALTLFSELRDIAAGRIP